MSITTYIRNMPITTFIKQIYDIIYKLLHKPVQSNVEIPTTPPKEEKAMPSRKIEDLVPEMQPIVYKLIEEVKKQLNIKLLITCTYRPQAEQDELYAQGRTKPGKIVTWTKISRHTSRRAVDVVPLTDKNKADWNSPHWEAIGQIGESLGLAWGGRWKSKDMPHFELK